MGRPKKYSEAIAPPVQGTDKRKRLLYKCPVCGHEWVSYSLGLRASCPACYERKYGRKPGASAEVLEKARQAKLEKLGKPKRDINANQVNIFDVAEEATNPNTEAEEIAKEVIKNNNKPKKSFMEKLLNYEI